MPACVDTSVYSIGPEGRGGVGLGEGDGAWLATSELLAFVVVTACGLQAERKTNETSRKQRAIDLRRIGISLGLEKRSINSKGKLSEARNFTLESREKLRASLCSKFLSSCFFDKVSKVAPVEHRHRFIQNSRLADRVLREHSLQNQERFYERAVKKKVSPKPPKVLGS